MGSCSKIQPSCWKIQKQVFNNVSSRKCFHVLHVPKGPYKKNTNWQIWFSVVPYACLVLFAGCFSSIQTSYLMHLCLGFLSSNGSFMMKYFSYRQNKWVPTIIFKKKKNRWHNIFYVLWDTTCRSFSHFVLFLWFFSKENFMLFDLFYIFGLNLYIVIFFTTLLLITIKISFFILFLGFRIL